MESLRRLTSSVFDAGPVRLVRRASLGDERPPDARSLDLTFMTDRLIVVGAPSCGASDKKSNRVNAEELAQFLDAHHRARFMLFNLNALEDVAETDAQAVADALHEQLLEFNWERDGMKAHTPPLELVFRICYALHAWLSLDARHVALVNCQTGKTRSGVVVACYLLFARLADDPTDAFVEFYRRRWDMKALTPQALRGKTPPSIQRFLAAFHALLRAPQHQPPNDRPLLLKAIIFRQLPVELQPCVQIWDDYKLVFCTEAAAGAETPVLDWNEEDGFFAILWENGVELDGGFSILCSFGDDYDNADDVDASSRVLFRYADSTLFLLPGLVTLKKHDLDLMKQYEHGFDEDQFSVDLVLHENTARKPRNSVRMDCTGNSAIRQGLVEITKHHVVLPDPAMHSNFIRMGFCETPTTFALQCSQNAPNVALDLLHSKGLSACFAQEAAEIAAKKEQEETVKDNQNLDSPTGSDQQPQLRRQTTAEIVAMQSQRSRYSIPTAVDSSLCDTCKEDDYMMRPQIVRCAGRCGKYYHTTCVGLRKIPFGLTTMSDRTNHAVYVKKFFSAWECDACAPKSSPLSTATLPNGEIPANMKLVPSSWVGGEPGNPQDVADAGRSGDSTRNSTRDNLSVAVDAEVHATTDANAPEEFNQLKEFLATNGLSIEDLMKAATSPGTTSASVAMSLANTLAAATAVAPPKVDVKSALLSEKQNARKYSDSSEMSTASNGDSKYALMLKRGVPFEAVQNCMRKDGVDPSTLNPLPPSENTLSDSSCTSEATDDRKVKLKDMEEFSSYFRMLRMGCPKEAVKQKLMMDGIDPVILDLGPDAIYEEVKDRIAATQSVSKLQDDIKCVKPTTSENAKDAASEILLKDHEVYAKYFKMLQMGLPEGAVRQKMKVDGVDERALDLGGDTPFSKLPKPPAKEESVDPKSDMKLKDDPKFAKYFKMLQMGLPGGAVRQKMKADGVDERALDLGGDAKVSQLAGPLVGNGIKLQDDPTYAKYFKMLKMGLPEGAVRQKMKSEGVDEHALDLGGDALVSELTSSQNDVKLQDDPVYSKYFKMLKMGLPEGAVKQKMVTENADVRALELGPDATVSQLSSTGDAKTRPAVAKPKRPRKKLHWQPISEDRLSNLNQQTIWEDEDDDVDFDMDMDELEALFFANQNTGSGKKNSSRGQSKALKRKQSVTLIDGKRAMNAAISLARVKLSYSDIAQAVIKFDPNGLTLEQLVGINEFLPTSEEAALVSGYTGDKEMLGEAEKFILEIAKVKRYAPRMESLVYKLSFTSRSAELAVSLAHLQKAGEEVKGSRLLKILLAMVLKLGNTLNGSGEENGIKGFTVDSLLRLGHTKAVNQKTTVLHYLVRLVKKNHPQVLDFQDELRSVPLAARESFDTIDDEYKKLDRGLTSLNNELALLEKQAVESLGLEVTIKSMQTAGSDIEAQMKALKEGIDRAREEVSSVLDYFGEDPKRNPTEFFTTLASFCTMFQRARNEVDAADEAAQRAERLKMRRSNSMRPQSKPSSGSTLKVGHIIRNVVFFTGSRACSDVYTCDDPRLLGLSEMLCRCKLSKFTAIRSISA
ncbi:formin-homology 2 domain-containing protein [Phytophthora cinnamomi]|uniref:formin-homology 2 domain-containing protein n=1 Tax=Phytophthora cinnamomi TaxID=4785 RepID=UPI00355AA270|nr:formin-homology 2 domain-containing protein [Phytophthora cinnamomi]